MKPRLLNAVRRQAQTDIEVWDGANFQPETTKVSIVTLNKDANLPWIRMSTEPNDPLNASGSSVIRVPITGEIFVIVSSIVHSHKGEAYQTIYNMVKCIDQFEIVDYTNETSSASGLSYGVEQADKVENVVALTYTHITVRVAVDDNVGTRNRNKQTKVSPYTCMIDGRLQQPSRSQFLRRVSDGICYQIQTADKIDAEAYLCTLSLMGE